MTHFQHILVLVSIIIGLALTDVLTSLHRLLVARNRVRFHWLPLTWALLLFVAATQFWWAFYHTAQHAAWTNFFAFLFVLLELVTLYLIASMSLPDVAPGGEIVDLVEHYFQMRWWFFGLIALYITLLVLDRVIRGNSLLDPIHTFHAVGLVLIFILMLSRNYTVHSTVTALTALVFFTFVFRHTLTIE